MTEPHPHVLRPFPKREAWVLGAILEERASTHRDRPFLQWEGGGELSFADVNRIVNRLANGLRQAGVGRGERVIIMLPNCLDYVFVWFALNKLGAVEVPVNIDYRGEFLVHAANSSGSQIAIVDHGSLQRFSEVEQRLDHLRTLYVRGERVPKDVQWARIVTEEFTDLVSDDDRNPGLTVDYRETAAILFTSGTTGRSKGILMPHSQLYFFAQQCVDLVRLTDSDTYMNPFPLFHANAQLLTVYPCLIVGAKAALYQRFSGGAWVRRARATGATVTNLLGVTMDYVFKQPPLPDDRQNQLRLILAAPVVHDIIPAWRERFGPHLFATSYGQTETGWPIVAPYAEPYPDGAVGKAVDEWFDVRIVDPETDEQLGPGQVGELVVRNKVPGIMSQGYNGEPEATLRATRNLWWHTGDALKVDEEGWFYFVDRVNDALRVRGENVSSFEVEQVVLAHGAIDQCAAVGVRSDVAGGEQEVKVFVVLKPDSPFDPADLIHFCEANAPWFAVPRYVEVVSALPKTPNEKIRKSVLREIGITPSTWDRVVAGIGLKKAGPGG